MRVLDGLEQPRAQSLALHLGRHHQHADQARGAGDDAADRAHQRVAVDGLQHRGHLDVLADTLHRFLQRRDLPHLAGARLGLEGDLLQREDGGGVLRVGGNDLQGLGQAHGVWSRFSRSCVGYPSAGTPWER